MPRQVEQGLAKARRNSRSLCHFGASAHSGRRIRRACGAVVEGGSFGLSAMTVTAALGWMMPQAQAQVMSAPEWCAEFLDSKPHPAPIVNLFERVRDAIPAKGESEAMADFEQRLEVGLLAQDRAGWSLWLKSDRHSGACCCPL